MVGVVVVVGVGVGVGVVVAVGVVMNSIKALLGEGAMICPCCKLTGPHKAMGTGCIPALRARIAELEAVNVPRPLDEWHEDIGTVLWWRFPVEEPPYVGGPCDDDWPGYHTHWTPIIVPALRGEGEG